MASKGFVRVVVAVVGVLSLLGGTAQATIAYQVPAGTVGNQAFTGPLGMDFDVNSPIRVTELGVFDSAQDGLVNTITAYIYDRTTQTSIASLSFTAASPGTLVAGSRMKALPAPIVLPAGFQGSIVAENFGASDQNGNSSTPAWTTDSGGGLVSFVGSARWGPTPGLYPPNPDDGPANRYATGTLEFFSVNTLALGHISPITVPNPSFELPGRPDGGFGNDTTAWTPSAGNNAGDFNPLTAGFPFIEPLPDGDHIAFVNSGSFVSNPLGETLQPNTLYILEVDWGHRTNSPNPQHSMSLQAGGTRLGSVNNEDIFNGPTPAPGQFETARGYFTTNHNASVGAPLDIVLDDGGLGQSVYDNVRLRKITGAAIPVVNPSFEANDVAPGGGFQWGATGWVESSPGSSGGPFEGASFITPADGPQSAFIIGGNSLTQTLDTIALEPNYRYILLVDVADRNSANFAGYLVELLAGGVPVAADNNSLGVVQFGFPGPPGFFYTTSVIDFRVGSIHPQLFQELGIRLSALGGGGNQTYFDNVRLFAVNVPEPTTLTLLGLAGAALAARRRRRTRRRV